MTDISVEVLCLAPMKKDPAAAIIPGEILGRFRGLLEDDSICLFIYLLP